LRPCIRSTYRRRRGRVARRGSRRGHLLADGYSPKNLADQIKKKADFETFFHEAPALHPNAGKITGVVCGVRFEEIDDPLMQKIRYLDKLVDELAKGRPMAKILRE
jgi:hypothetical protein